MTVNSVLHQSKMENESDLIQEFKTQFTVPVLLSMLSIGVLFSLPAIIYSRWFPLDLGGIFLIGTNLSEKLEWILSPYNGSGRYFPFYWLYNSAQVQLFGTEVSKFFLVQSVVFFALTAAICSLFYKLVARPIYVLILFVAIYLSTPVAENLYSLGKAETIAGLFLLMTVLLFAVFHLREEVMPKMHQIAIAVVFALALWTKETSIALLGFSTSGCILSLLLVYFRRQNADRMIAAAYFRLSIVLVLGLAISKAPYAYFSKKSSGADYLDYVISTDLVFDNVIFYVSQQPDVLAFGVLSLLVLYLAGRSILVDRHERSNRQDKCLILVISLCAMAWAYYLVLLIWRWPMGYYMLLPAIIFKLCTLYGFVMISFRKRMWTLTKLATVLVGLCSLLYATLSFAYVASSQVAYSRLYSEAIEKYVGLTDGKVPLVIESYPFYSEQVTSTAQILEASTGRSFSINGVADVLDPAVPTPLILKLLNVSQSQLLENLKKLPKQGDYLLVFTGSKLATWFLRGVTPYYSKDSILKIQGAYELELKSERLIRTPSMHIHVWDGNLVFEQTYLGYKLYKVLEDQPKFLWSGRYPDGWMGSEGKLKVNSNYRNKTIVKYSAPDFTLPNKLRILRKGQLLKEINITDTNEHLSELGENSDSPVEYQFEILNTKVPKLLGLNKDKRPLGIRISLVNEGSQ
jgi:hypothetical protein